MARSPEKSDPEIHFEEISLEELPHSLTNSGVRKVQEIPGYVDSESSPPQRFTIPPPASQVVQKDAALLELDAVDVESDEFDLPLSTDDDFEIYSANESMPPTVIPPASDNYDGLIESETRLRTAVALSTPPVQACPEMYTVPEFPLDVWESINDTALQLFSQLGIDLVPITESFRQNIQASNVFHYQHEIVLTMMLLRDATAMMQAYLMEGTRPSNQEPLGSFLLEKLKHAKLRESIYPGDGSVDAFIEDKSYDTFQQIRTIMIPPLESLKDVLKERPSLNSMYELIIFNWGPE